jgi:molybdopterin molybdotransferase
VALISVADALANVLADAAPLPAERASPREAHGRVLAEDLVALRTQPPADMSAMDGYAVRAVDVVQVPAELTVIGEVAAGHPFARAIGKGEAARIFTGGVIPPGADCVVVQENVERAGNRILVRASTDGGKHVRRAGFDFAQGDKLLTKGRVLSGRDLMLAAAMNHPDLPVHRRPKVAVLATGDELVMPGTQPGPGQIICSNAFAIMALARSEGAEVMDLGLVPDRHEETAAAVRRARGFGADILVTSGGASVGDYDLVQSALAAEGLNLTFWKVALRPGRPLMHGRIGPLQVLGLPGNPVSAFVCGVLFLLPLLRKLSGRSDLTLPHESAQLGRDLPANDERTDYLRAALRTDAAGRMVATPFPAQDSSMMALLAKADCLVIREPYAPAAKAGMACPIVKLPL